MNMLSERMLSLGLQSSVIRDIFEYGLKRKKEIGNNNVFDFSLGNPSVPPPKEVNQILMHLIETIPAEKLHGYTSGPGGQCVRSAVADYIKNSFDFAATSDLIYLTCGQQPDWL